MALAIAGAVRTMCCYRVVEGVKPERVTQWCA